MTEKTTNNKNKIIESNIRAKIIYSGKKEGVYFRVPYDLEIRTIGGSKYEIGFTGSTYHCAIPKKELFGINTILYEPFLCTEDGNIFDDAFFILDASNKDVLVEQERLGFTDFQVAIIIELREIYSTDLIFNKYEKYPFELWTGLGYERVLNTKYSIYTDERDLQVDYTITAIKNGKSVTIDSRYETEKNSIGIWKSYNPDGTGWNTNNNWSSGWCLQDTEEQVLLEMLERLDAGGSSFKELYYSGWIEDIEPIDLFEVREFEINFDDFKDDIGYDPFHRYFGETADEIEEETVKFTVKIENIQFIEDN